MIVLSPTVSGCKLTIAALLLNTAARLLPTVAVRSSDNCGNNVSVILSTM